MDSDPSPYPSVPDPERDSSDHPFSLAVTGLLLALMFLLGLGAGYLVWGKSAAAAQAAITPQTTPVAVAAATATSVGTEQAYNVTRYDVPEDDDPVYGAASAPITIIEFSDYECAYCIKWHQDVWPRLQAEYGDQIRLVYRDFPLYGMHANASPAAQAANCAGEQDAYWPYHDLLFSQNMTLGSEAYLAYAEQLNLDSTKFKECIESESTAAEVEADYTYAANLGVTGTPTFFINGMAMVGSQPYENFKQLIDLELAGKLPK